MTASEREDTQSAASKRHAVMSNHRVDADDDNDEQALRTSTEVRQHDHETITAEEEAERLLSAAGSTPQSGPSDDRGWKRSKRRSRWRAEQGGESELLYKVEEGARSSSTESGGSSASSGEGGDGHGRLEKLHANRIPPNKTSYGKFAAIHVVIVVAFLALLYGAYKASSFHARTSSGGKKPTGDAVSPALLSNGTHQFAPTTILISLDGFRADFVHRGLTPTLSAFIKQGVSPKYMLPSFPSLTFPNHFTLVTGLYPQHHGIVGNSFWDPDMQQEFYYTDPEKSMRPEFWNAEPLWVTAESQGLRSAIHMWPGSEAHITGPEPSFVDKYRGNEPLHVKVNRILGWLDLPGANDTTTTTPGQALRPQLIAAYVPNVDTDGHKYGPNSTYIRSTIAEVDGMLGAMFKGIGERNLTKIVNVVVVSDHGMATTSSQRLIQLEDLIDTSLVEHTDGWPLYGLRLHDQSEQHLDKIYKSLLAKSQSPQYKGQFDVYLRDRNMPARFHFSENSRIAPLWIVPQAGWAIVTKEEFDLSTALAEGREYDLHGLHGYDFEHPLMRAIFVARGPAFPHPEGSQLEPFQNIELYNIVCDSLGLQPRPNNGTLRLPLTPKGLHDFEAEPDVVEDLAHDGVVGTQLLPPDLPGIDLLPPVPSKSGAALQADDGREASGGKEADGVAKGGEGDDGRTWSEWFNGKFEDAKDWAAGIFGGGGGGEDGDQR